ncbi:hypothetical protein [Nocardioides ochotonae]|uniref:hypothetical protein n=1 Tax=Nocardioides ochotonae TaxID=2685869 RepID=UPI00140A2314|nr:hypothetical protein [Nocardioides ochotonae]
MPEQLEIYVDGEPLTVLGYWGSPVLTDRCPYGSRELAWEAPYSLHYRHPVLRKGAEVVAQVGPSRRWLGRLAELDWEAGDFVAEGAVRQGETALAKGPDGRGSTDLDEVIELAYERGAITWTTREEFGSLTTDEVSESTNSVLALLDAHAAEEGVNLAVSVDGLLYTEPDPTEPKWMVTPGAGRLGVADEDYWTSLTGVFSPAPGTYDTVTATDTTAGVLVREAAVDLTGRGYIGKAKAQQILDRLLAQGRVRNSWTNSITVTHGQVLSMGGTPVGLSVPRAGDRFHLAGLYDERGASASTEIVAEETVWDVAEGTLQIKPQGLAARDLASIVETMGGVLL